MRELNHKLKTGRTLKRVREIREQLAQLHVAQAHADVHRSTEEEEVRENELQSFDHELHAEASDGMSMRSFMHYQELRGMHVAAVGQAREERQSAEERVTEQRRLLMDATTQRRSAERLVSLISARRAVAFRRFEQKQADDMTCARFGQGDYDDAA